LLSAPLHSDTGAAATGSAGADCSLFQDYDIFNTFFGEIPGDCYTGNTSADDDDISSFGIRDLEGWASFP
jgi:hypothetical protein